MGKIISFAAARAASMSSAAAWHDAVAAFLDDLTIANRSERTIGQHQAELRRYNDWLNEQGFHWAAMTPADLSAYSRTRAGLSVSSRCALIGTMRVFYGWAIEQGRIDGRSPAEHLRTPRRGKPAPRSLSSEQVKQLLAHLTSELARDSSHRMQRDRALILTALYSGLRAAELAALHWSHVDLHGCVITVVSGKGKKGRSVKSHPDLVPILTAWRLLQEGAPDGPVFALGPDVICSNRVGKIVRRYAKATRLPLTTHVLRHTFATISLRKSGNLYSVSRALGHAQLAQTQMYLRGDTRDGDAAVDSLPGLDDW